jgi:excisionase family DNA binding protein
MRIAFRAPMGLRSVFVDDAAAMLRMSRRTVYYRIREGRLRTIRTAGGSQRVLVESIAALLRERAPRPSGVTQLSKSEALALEIEPLA